MIDGVRVGSATTGSPTWSRIPLSESIASRSCADRHRRSGNDAIGGVVQIFTRRGDGRRGVRRSWRRHPGHEQRRRRHLRRQQWLAPQPEHGQPAHPRHQQYREPGASGYNPDRTAAQQPGDERRSVVFARQKGEFGASPSSTAPAVPTSTTAGSRYGIAGEGLPEPVRTSPATRPLPATR